MSNPQLEIITIEPHHSRQLDHNAAATTTSDSRTEGSHCTAATAAEGAESQVASASKHNKHAKNNAGGGNDPHCSLLTGHSGGRLDNTTETHQQQQHQQSFPSAVNSSSGSTLIDIESAGVVGKQQKVQQQPHLHFAISSELLQLHRKDKMNSSSSAAASNGSSNVNINTTTNTTGSTSPAAPSTILASSSAISTSQTNLVRKHSCGDLVSRLKSRKLLGVGESSENRGEVYRSKISQLLGHSEHLFAKFPLAFWHWYAVLIVLTIAGGLWNLFSHLLLQPTSGDQRGKLSVGGDTLSTNRNSMSDNALMKDNDGLLAISTFFRQFCGILYLALATLLWRFYRINDKGLVRYILLACSILSLAKIILLLYYDHCSVIEVKDWLISFVCSSRCGPEPGDVSSSSTGSCSLFARASSTFQSHIIYSSGELTAYLFLESLEVLINLLYRHRMAGSGGGGGGAGSGAVNSSGSSSLLTTGAIGASRRVSTPAGAASASGTAAFPCCEYVSLLLGTYVVDPVAGLFRRLSTTTENNTNANQTVGESASEGQPAYEQEQLSRPPPSPTSPDDQIITSANENDSAAAAASAINTKAAKAAAETASANEKK
ncbi:hypothetical protein TYRP_003467 [Tyrophagus putrescentiae]|nr:hypothetical protein TYRP_003467 [Tyrophagus putrescentiae]